jgi:chemotaxis protein CheX
MNSVNQMAAANENIPENWLPLLQLAVKEVFEIMLGSKLEPHSDSGAAPKDFTAMVGLAGQLCGVMTMRCSAQSAALIASKMLGIDPKEANAEMWDAIGEVANMIAGNFKNKLTGMGDRCMLSVPTVITGADYSFHSLADSTPLEVTMAFEGEPIVVNLEIHS